MNIARIHVGLTAEQLRKIDKIAKKLGIDRTNAIRYCISRVAEIENIK